MGFLNLPFFKRTVAYMTDDIKEYCYVDETFEDEVEVVEDPIGND